MKQNLYALRDIADIVLYQNINGVDIPVLELETLKMANINSETEVNEVRGGRGNNILSIFEGSRSINIEVEDAVLNSRTFALQSGNALKQIDNVNYEIIPDKQDAVADGTNPVTLQDIVYDPQQTIIFGADTGQQYTTITTGTPTANQVLVENVLDPVTSQVIRTEITFDVGVTEKVKVFYNKKVEDGEAFFILSDKFQNCTFKMVAKTTVQDVNEDGCEITKMAYVIINKVKLDSSFSVPMSPDGDASTFDKSVFIQ